MFNDIKLRKRMILGYSIPVGLFILLTGFVYSNGIEITEAFEQVELKQETVIIGQLLEDNYREMVKSLRGYLLFEKEDVLIHYNQAENRFNEASISGINTITNLRQLQRFEEMVKLKQDYDDFSQQIIALVRQNQSSEALALFRTGAGQQSIDRFIEVSDQFNDAEHEILNQATAEARQAINRLNLALVLGALMCLGGSAIAAFGISSGISRTIAEAVSRIANSSTEIAATLEQQESTTSLAATAVSQTTS
ncbi:MAG: CHASE3 domain-containing protein, partial [Chroococcales cyanobacterium]